MSELTEQNLLAIHLHRSPDGSWYAVGNFRDKRVGKNGTRVVAENLSPAKVTEILKCLE